MDVKAISIKEFLKNKNDIYKNINVVAKRARQIIDTRYDKVLAMQNIDDTDQLEEFIDDDFDKPKSISKAMDEFIGNKLEFRNLDEEESKDSNE